MFLSVCEGNSNYFKLPQLRKLFHIGFRDMAHSLVRAACRVEYEGSTLTDSIHQLSKKRTPRVEINLASQQHIRDETHKYLVASGNTLVEL